jgi:hypothetical protein
MKLTKAIVTLFSITALFLTGCSEDSDSGTGSGSDAGSVIGSWTSPDEEGMQMIFTFDNDNKLDVSVFITEMEDYSTGEMLTGDDLDTYLDDMGTKNPSVMSGTWSTNGSTMTVTIAGETNSGTYSVSGSTLSMTTSYEDEDGETYDDTIVLEKV